MSIKNMALCACGVFAASAVFLAPGAQAKEMRREVQTEYARIVGGAGYGFCEFTRIGRRVSVRVRAAGMDYGSVGTAWMFVDGANVGRLDGTIADSGGDAVFHGRLTAPRRAEVKIDVRDHRVSIKSIGNTPNDEMADETLVRELTTPAPYKMGTCAVNFGG